MVGAGLGGLAAAALACGINKRTIVLEPGETVGGSVRARRQDGLTFYLGPSLSFGYERGGSLQRLNETLGIAQNASLRSPCYQVALPDRRITVYGEPSETLDELRREFPREIDRIAAFYQDIRKLALQRSKSAAAAFLSRSRKASGFLQKYRFSPEFSALLDVQAYYFFFRPAASLRLSSLITLCDSAPLTLEDGFVGQAERILDVILRNGGEIRYRVPIEHMTLEPGGLTLPDQSIQTETVLLNTERQEGRSFLVAGVKPDVVPAGMLQDVLCVPDYEHPERFFTLSINFVDNQDAAASEMRTLTGCFFNSSNADAYKQKEQVARMVPFLDDFTVFGGMYRPVPREIGGQDNMRSKPARKADCDLLERFSMPGKYLIRDGAGTPLQSIETVYRFMQYLR